MVKRIHTIPTMEIFLSMISLWWALVLFFSGNTFERLPRTYSFFNLVADERAWATVFFIAALIKILGIILRKTLLRKVGLLLSAGIYAMIAGSYFLGVGWFSIGFGTFGVVTVMAIWGIREVEQRDA